MAVVAMAGREREPPQARMWSLGGRRLSRAEPADLAR